MKAVQELKPAPRANGRANLFSSERNALTAPRNGHCRGAAPTLPGAVARPVQGPPADGAAHRSRAASDCLWVTKLGDQIVARLQLAQAAQVLRLCEFRLDPEWRHTRIPEDLVRRLRAYCSEQGCSKLVADASHVPCWFCKLLNRGGFRCSCQATAPGRALYEFSLDPCQQQPQGRRACDCR